MRQQGSSQSGKSFRSSVVCCSSSSIFILAVWSTAQHSCDAYSFMQLSFCKFWSQLISGLDQHAMRSVP